ncbi:MAG: double zinc ribbon domain-containing protein [Candidatus Omnitrophota bacterium]
MRYFHLWKSAWHLKAQNNVNMKQSLKAFFTQCLQGMLDIVFPRNCLLCRNYHPTTNKNPLCPSCRAKLPWNKHPVKTTFSTPVHFDQSISLLHYTQSAQILLKQFKFHNKSSLRHTCASLFKEFIKHHPLNINPNAIIIPIPLHPSRLRERGYNQSTLMAIGLNQSLNLQIREDILERHRPTDHQSRLHAKERWTNLKSAFRILPLANIVGSEIVLLDDTITTGATASEAAKTLKKAGALRVILITLATATCESCTTTS